TNNVLPSSSAASPAYADGLINTSYHVPSQTDRSGMLTGSYTFMTGWFLRDTLSTQARFLVDNTATSTTGATYSYGFNGANTTSDRALGALSSVSESP